MSVIARSESPVDEEEYGLGQIFRDFKIHPTKADFLSKDVYLINNEIHIRRMFERVIKGSHMTKSVGKTLTAEEYHTAVTVAL